MLTQRMCRGLYIKFGQGLSLQSAILPSEYKQVLRVLLDDAPSVEYAEVERMIKEDFGVSPEELFVNFSPTPIASASIAQVHRAQLKDGTEVAVKIQKPYIRSQMEWDLAIYGLLMQFVEWAFDLPVTHFSATIQSHLRQEIDFEREGRNAEECMRAIEQEPRLRGRIYVPRVFWQQTSPRVLTTEWAEGQRMVDSASVAKAGFDMTEAMRLMVELFSHQIFVTGFVHCK
jgi:aarF domain-containing kinase